ncbi:MAG: hypothetical protein NTX50_32565, partial [Candidatus Sumerlaeota bacterium]|nr:hypothetical protein [Candidatus Sumerlaeota bacterium]
LKEGSKQPYSKSWRRSLPQSLTRYAMRETVSLSIRALGCFCAEIRSSAFAIINLSIVNYTQIGI